MDDFILKIVDKRIRITPIYKYAYCRCYHYIDDENPEASVDFSLAATPEDVIAEKESSAREDEFEGIATRQFSDEYFETLYLFRSIAEKLLESDTILLHGSALAVDGSAVIFTGPSGAGKSTHAALWRNNFEGVVTINDDKPFIQFREGTPYACGTPWDGKDRLSTNVCLPVRAICIMKQSAVNRMTEITWQEAFAPLLQQTYRPKDSKLMKKTLEIFGGFTVSGVKVYNLECNMELEAAKTSFREIFGKEPILKAIEDEE